MLKKTIINGLTLKVSQKVQKDLLLFTFFKKDAKKVYALIADLSHSLDFYLYDFIDFKDNKCFIKFNKGNSVDAYGKHQNRVLTTNEVKRLVSNITSFFETKYTFLKSDISQINEGLYMNNPKNRNEINKQMMLDINSLEDNGTATNNHSLFGMVSNLENETFKGLQKNNYI